MLIVARPHPQTCPRTSGLREDNIRESGDSCGGGMTFAFQSAPVKNHRSPGLEERRECYLAVGGGWLRPCDLPQAEDRPRQGLKLDEYVRLDDETDACSTGAAGSRGRLEVGTVRYRSRDRGHEPRRDRQLQHAARKIRGGNQLFFIHAACEWRIWGRYEATNRLYSSHVPESRGVVICKSPSSP